MTNYKHYVSLGHFCSVALDLEALGLRDASLPFDWNIDLDFAGVMDCIRGDFAGFLDEEELRQSLEDRAHYMNRYGIQFFHDFNPYEPLKDQLPAVQAKYGRRIARFYAEIAEPTLFIRYITDQIRDEAGRSLELDYVEAHYEEIRAALKRYNPENEILFIANAGVSSKTVPIYSVEKDKGDVVARVPRKANAELGKLLDGFTIVNQEANREKGRAAARRREFERIRKALRKKSDKLLGRKYYEHDKTY